MNNKTTQLLFLVLSLVLSISTVPGVLSQSDDECRAQSDNTCTDKSKAIPLKVIAIFSILIASLIGVCLPFFTRKFSILRPEKSPFLIVKAFASGVILATGFVHILPDSFDMLSSSCLKDTRWHKFPFTGFVAMLSAVFTLLVDSIVTSVYTDKEGDGGSSDDTVVTAEVETPDHEMRTVTAGGHFHGHGHVHGNNKELVSNAQQLLRHRVIAMVLELGIVAHSIVIGLSVGATNNTCTIKVLTAALCFHQMFEGMGLGGCILQAEYGWVKKSVMAFFYAVTTPFGVLLGTVMSRAYRENSPRSLITVGLLNASSAGLLIYMALVDLLAAEFLAPKMQGSIKLQLKSVAAVLLGIGSMSVIAKWT